ncbi:MAG: twin-arginine translocase TatA/TatE family subunit [Chloroflexota bacterium]|nr:twin-arginine translocase TatA/TatE family subunit [Chloroflexota bacterium]
MFQSFGLPEVAIILVIILIVFGVGKLPQVGGALGKGIREFRKAKSGEDSDGVKKLDKSEEDEQHR